MKLNDDVRADLYADALSLAGDHLAESFRQIAHEFIQRRSGPGLHEIASAEMPGWRISTHHAPKEKVA